MLTGRSCCALTTHVHTLNNMLAKSDDTHLLSGIKSSKPTNKSQKLDLKRFLLFWNMRRCLDCPCVHIICKKQWTIHVPILFRTNWYCMCRGKHGTLCKPKWNRTMVKKLGQVCTLLSRASSNCIYVRIMHYGTTSWVSTVTGGPRVTIYTAVIRLIHSPLVLLYVLDTPYNCGTQLTRGLTVPRHKNDRGRAIFIYVGYRQCNYEGVAPALLCLGQSM